MIARTLAALMLILSLAASAQAADPQLITKLKELGKAVDDVAVNISNATIRCRRPAAGKRHSANVRQRT